MNYTYQDFLENKLPVADFVKNVISRYQSSELYKTACFGDDYDHQRNTTICNTVRMIYKLNGQQTADPTSSNNRIASNIFRRLNTQRCQYSLGNGIDFADEKIKDKFPKNLDAAIKDAGYDALIHGVSYLFVSDILYEFEATEFAPLLDEYTGDLRGGVRFWRLAPEKPLIAVFYEENGYTKFAENEDGAFIQTDKKRGYMQKVQTSKVFGEEVIGEINFPALPIVALWGTRLHQSTLVGMRAAIDALDLIRSGFANDLTDCAEIYWILENYGGMQEDDLRQFLNRLKLNHIASANTADGGKIVPYTQEIPYSARKVFIDDIRASIYEDFGGLDVHTIAAGATNDHIDAAYQPLDENADDYEAQITKCIQKIGNILNVDSNVCIPIFKRNRISNETERTDMILQAAEYLDDETILQHLPFLTADEKEGILERKAAEEQQKTNFGVDEYGQSAPMD